MSTVTIFDCRTHDRIGAIGTNDQICRNNFTACQFDGTAGRVNCANGRTEMETNVLTRTDVFKKSIRNIEPGTRPHTARRCKE